jgi:uncharacterized protein YcfL
MRKITMIAALGATLLCSPFFVHAAEGGSIASKIEELGKMTYLKVSDLRAVKRDGLLRLQVTISNSSNDPQQLYYRFRWLDDDGFTVWEEEPWKPEVVYGQQRKVINAVSPSFKATDFRLELQSSKNEGTPSSGNNTSGGITNQ